MRTQYQTIYKSATVLLTLLMLGATVLVYYRYDIVEAHFAQIDFPDYLIRPIAILNVLAIAAIWWVKHQTIREWAYAGLSFELLFAIYAQWANPNYGLYFALGGFICLLVSYLSRKKMGKRKRRTYY